MNDHDQLCKYLQRIEEQLEVVRKAVLGNGKPEQSLCARLAFCESRLKQVMVAFGTVIGIVLTAAAAVAFSSGH